MGVLVESLHEEPADDLALALRICHSCESAEEFLGCVCSYHIESHIFIRLHHIFELVLAEKSVVHEDTCEVVADGLVQQHGSHCGIHAAAQSQNDLVIADLCANLVHCRVNE